MNDYNFITHPYSLKKYSIYSPKGNYILNKFIQYAGLIYTQQKCNEIKLELQEKPEICYPQENPDYCRDYRDNCFPEKEIDWESRQQQYDLQNNNKEFQDNIKFQDNIEFQDDNEKLKYNTNWCINVKNNIDNIPMYCHPDEYYEDCQNYLKWCVPDG